MSSLCRTGQEFVSPFCYIALLRRRALHTGCPWAFRSTDVSPLPVMARARRTTCPSTAARQQYRRNLASVLLWMTGHVSLACGACWSLQTREDPPCHHPCAAATAWFCHQGIRSTTSAPHMHGPGLLMEQPHGTPTRVWAYGSTPWRFRCRAVPPASLADRGTPSGSDRSRCPERPG
jgi:hypothetical protein